MLWGVVNFISKNEFLTMFWILSSCLQLQSMVVRASVNINFSHLDCFISLKINYRLFFEKFGFLEFCLDNIIYLVPLIWKSAYACSFTNCVRHSVKPAAFWLCRWLSDIRICSWRIKLKIWLSPGVSRALWTFCTTASIVLNHPKLITKQWVIHLNQLFRNWKTL